MSRRHAVFREAVLAASTLISVSTFAGPVVPDGVRVHFSPHGQEYFRSNLNTVLLANDLDLSKTYWDEVKFVLVEPLKESRIGDARRGIHERLVPYFYGFPINPPKIEVKLAHTNLHVKFKSMGAEIDPAGPAAYGHSRSKGILILMRLEAETLKFDAKTLRLNDLANPGLLGVMGLDAISSKLSDTYLRTVKVELPVLVEADGKAATMRVLAVRTNLQKTGFDAAFEKVLVPKIKLVIAEKEYPFDQAAFERDLRDQLPQLGDALTATLKSYFEKEGKDLIQPSFDNLAKSLNIDFNLPLSDEKDSGKELTIKLRPKSATFTRSRHLGLSFDTEIVDEKLDGGRGVFPTPGTSGEATLASFDAATYDVAMTLHPSAVNGVLNRAWAKGILRDIDMGKDDQGKPTKVKIPKPPIVSFEKLPKANQANFHAWIGYVVRGIGGILFKGPIPIELDLVVSLETNAKNEVEIVFDHIDETTLKVDTRATWLSPIRSKVNKMVREKIAKLNQDARTKRQLLTSLPTLDELLGIPLALESASTEAGNLVLLADFAPKP